MGIHVDHPWAECVKEFDAPLRVYLHCYPLGSVIVGLPTLHPKPDLVRAQSWNVFRGSTDKWRRVVVHPNRRWECKEEVGEPFKNRLGHTKRFHCGAFRWHPGPHRQPDPSLMEQMAKRRGMGDPIELQFRCRVCKKPATAHHTVEDDEGTTVSYYCLEHAPEGAVTE